MGYVWTVRRGQKDVYHAATADEALEFAKTMSKQNLFTYEIVRVEETCFGRVKGGDYKMPAGITEEPSGRDGRGDRGY